jgi:hypothetical protein
MSIEMHNYCFKWGPVESSSNVDGLSTSANAGNVDIGMQVKLRFKSALILVFCV